MPKHDPDAERMRKYDRVAHHVATQDLIDVSQVKEACSDVGPHFVARVIQELKKDGHIANIPGQSKDKGTFEWTSGRTEFAPNDWSRAKVYRDRVTRAPLEDRPRERLLKIGADQLKLSELMAILIRSGNSKESAIQAGEKLAAAFSERLPDLAGARPDELSQISPAIRDTAYCQILAGIELGRRVEAARSAMPIAKRIDGSNAAVEYCAQKFARLASDAKHEEFHIVMLNTRNEPIGTHQVSVGTLDASLVHPREVFRQAIKAAAKTIILVHNHPSGDPTPGEQDVRVTRRLIEVAKLVGIDILDHIVVGQRGTISMRDAGLGFDG